MAFCISCGRELKDDDLFCPKCGAKNETVTVEEPMAAPESKEESIALADKLFSEYKSLERVTREIEDVKSRLCLQVGNTPKQHAAFKFFWPFLIYAAIAFTIGYVIASICAYSSPEAALFFLALGLIAIPILLIIGGVRAVRLREEYNRTEYDSVIRRNQQQELDKRNHDALIRKRQNILDKLKEYNPIVPVTLRDSASMSKIKILLQTDKAESFGDAVKILKR